MSVVAILGAGEIGGATARALAARGRVAVIRLIDEAGGVAAGKALDLSQAGPIAGSDTRLEGMTDVAAASGASVVVLADTVSGGVEWGGEPGLALLRRLQRFGILERSVVICAGASQRLLIQQGLDEAGIPRRRILGSAPEAIAATARSLVAIEAHVSPAQVALAVIGTPPDRMIVPWGEASIGGHSIASLMSASQLHHLEYRLRGLWPPGTGTLGSAAALFSEAVATGSRRLFSAFVSLDRDNGTTAPVCAWPIAVGPTGLERITSPSLTARERVVVDEVIG